MSQLHAQFMGSVLGMTWRRQLVSTPPVRHKPLLHQLCIQTFSESDRCHYSCFRQECLENTTGPQVNGVPEVKCLDSCSHQSGALLQHCCNASWEEAVCLMKEALIFSGYPLMRLFTAARTDSEARIFLGVLRLYSVLVRLLEVW